MKRLVLGIAIVVLIAGCGGRKSSLLLERPARGPLDDARSIGQAMDLDLEPNFATQDIEGIEVTVNQASWEFLKNFFDNEELFGPLAGKTPYYHEHLVFYIKIANNGPKKIFVQPDQFKLIDDRGNQLKTIGIDYVTAFAEFRTPVGTGARNMAQGARPGYFGISVPVGSMLIRNSQWRFALLKQSALQKGYMYPGVRQDGLIAFWSPSSHAKSLRLIVANITSDFNALEEPSVSNDFVFEFGIADAMSEKENKEEIEKESTEESKEKKEEEAGE